MKISSAKSPLKLDYFYNAINASQNKTKQNIGTKMTLFQEGSQEDAHELLAVLLDNLNQELISYHRDFVASKMAIVSSPISSIFGGEYSSTVSGPSIRDSVTMEKYTTLSLPISVR